MATTTEDDEVVFYVCDFRSPQFIACRAIYSVTHGHLEAYQVCRARSGKLSALTTQFCDRVRGSYHSLDAASEALHDALKLNHGVIRFVKL